MVAEAEKYKKDDEVQRDRITSKNNLEAYCFNMKQTLEDDKISTKISPDERKKISDACESALKWLDNNQTAEKDEYEHKLKETNGKY